jgi:hypothetical protein
MTTWSILESRNGGLEDFKAMLAGVRMPIETRKGSSRHMSIVNVLSAGNQQSRQGNKKNGAFSR